MPKIDQLIVLITRIVAFLVLMTALASFKDEPDALTSIELEFDEYLLFADCDNPEMIIQE